MTASVAKVLVIDDHVLFREGIMGVFQSAPDFKVVGGAGSVFEGLMLARDLRPDIVLMDFNLPDGTGLDATRSILSELPNCKIVFLTIYETDENLFAAIRLGAKGFMLKNIAGVNLIASLRALERGEMAISRKLASRILNEFSRTPVPTNNSQEAISALLSHREMDVLRELESGATNLEIAQRLFLSENTIKHHISNVLEKLGVKNRRQAALLARQNGIRSKYSVFEAYDEFAAQMRVNQLQ